MGHILERGFAALQLLLERSALRPADLDEVILGILALLKHRLDCSSHFSHQLILSSINNKYSQKSQQHHNSRTSTAPTLRTLLRLSEPSELHRLLGSSVSEGDFVVFVGPMLDDVVHFGPVPLFFLPHSEAFALSAPLFPQMAAAVKLELNRQ